MSGVSVGRRSAGMTAAGLVLAVVTVTGCTHEAGVDAPGPTVTGPSGAATPGAAESASGGPAASGKPKAPAPIPGVKFRAATSVLATRWHTEAKDTAAGAPQVHLTAPYPGDGKATLDIWIGKGDGT